MAAGMTLNDFVLAANVDREMTYLLFAVASCCKEISNAIISANLTGVTG
jgi:hypothetical protein